MGTSRPLSQERIGGNELLYNRFPERKKVTMLLGAAGSLGSPFVAHEWHVVRERDSRANVHSGMPRLMAVCVGQEETGKQRELS